MTTTFRPSSCGSLDKVSPLTLIELVGCTSAGKSTLAARIVAKTRSSDSAVWTGDDFVLKEYHLAWLKSRIMRTMALDLLALGSCVVNCGRHWSFYRFVMRLIWRLPSGRIQRLNIARNVMKKIGLHGIIKRFSSNHQQIILVDEGTLHTAHYLFVHTTTPPNFQGLREFVQRVPLPDVAVYLKQDQEVLVERTMTRGHRRIPDCSRANVDRFITRAVDTFDWLSQELKQRFIVVNPQGQLEIPSTGQDDSRLISTCRLIQSGLEQRNSSSSEYGGLFANNPAAIHSKSGV